MSKFLQEMLVYALILPLFQHPNRAVGGADLSQTRR